MSMIPEYENSNKAGRQTPAMSTLWAPVERADERTPGLLSAVSELSLG